MKKYQTRLFFLWALVWALQIYFYNAAAAVFVDKDGQMIQSLLFFYLVSIEYTLVICALSVVYPIRKWRKFFRIYMPALAAIFVIGEVVGSIFILLDDLIRLGKLVGKSVFGAHGIDFSRSSFLMHAAICVWLFFVALLIFGMIIGPARYIVRRKKINLHNLPKKFEGLRIAHISDLHLGTTVRRQNIRKCVDLILAQKPDVIFFTGDLVNNYAKEIEPFYDELKRLEAPYGIFAVLGNHDYGDYVDWKTVDERNANLEHLVDLERSLGWNVLLNENIKIGTGDETIAIVGVENWGARKGFSKYGNLEEAYEDADTAPVILLLSHDPSHFEKIVSKDFRQIAMTFSGHTHGMQFGFELGKWRFSPSRLLFPHWAGLSHTGGQYLYVNRGLGMLGYPGRIGIYPEIAVFTLHTKAVTHKK